VKLSGREKTVQEDRSNGKMKTRRNVGGDAKPSFERMPERPTSITPCQRGLGQRDHRGVANVTRTSGVQVKSEGFVASLKEKEGTRKAPRSPSEGQEQRVRGREGMGNR